ncbi:hypothetical protein [Pedomonas mirosovicensis]|uniref:hypothetical protein n=1 Tax=Pedomonas mirosovicensis TaxID=2908641 RepID=UPI0021672FE9|nr:hypothetical protein [Pedomonas mirosovicensis]MCH8684234.1 hypothetical protein [Pedomonas mirosovicensis]
MPCRSRGGGRITGHFALLACKGGRLFILNDYFGAFHVYATPGHEVVATSFLAAAESLPRVSFDRQGLYEFVFNATPLGESTVLAEITKLSPFEQLELGEAVTVHAVRKGLDARFDPLAADVKQQADRLRSLFTGPLKTFGDNIQCPLSGGFDSRLVLALLLDAGVKPHVYVYGSDGDEDVSVATAIGKAEGFDVEVFNKAAYAKVDPDRFAEIVEHNFHEMDGVPIDGGLFDNGGNSVARHNRAKEGALAVSGAAGEIFRNYFYLRDRPFHSRDILYAFYSGFDPEDCTDAFDEAAYFNAMDAKLRRALGNASGTLTRAEVESAYPLFRCPPFFGREISMVGRFGAYFMPFFEYQMVRETIHLPVAARNHGAFQSQLLATIHPRLAGYMSAYGHSFLEAASLKHRLSEAVSLYRPPWLRRYGWRMKQAIKGRPALQPTGFMAPEYLGRVIDLTFPAMRRYFRMDRLADATLYRRIATLEHLAGKLGSRLAV